MTDIPTNNSIKASGRLGILGPRVIRREHRDWRLWSRGFAAHADYAGNEPYAVVVCKCASDVRKAISWAKAQGLPIRPRGGRHNYEGHSSCVQGGCVIDISGLKKFRIDAYSKRAWFGAGLNMLEVTEILSRYGLSMPYATGGTVGLAGFLLGGGVGINSRLWGLGSDHVLGFRLILASGNSVWVDPQSEPDLYFACLGSGGGNFGIVTEFEVRLHECGKAGIVRARWPWEQFEAVVDSWQRRAPDSDPTFTNFMTLSADRTISMVGQMTGLDPDEDGMRAVMQDIFPDCPPAYLEVGVVSAQDASRMFLRVSAEAPWGWHDHIKEQNFKSTSAFAAAPIPVDGLRTLREGLENHPPLIVPAPERSMVQLLCGGGQVHAPRVYPTATAHRSAQFILQYNGYWGAEEDKASVRHWTRDLRASLLPRTFGAYVNYVDDDIPVESRPEVYFGEDASRLIALKSRYDPNRVFSFPHGLP